ncbi:taxadiene 5-alpha hydroxylase [Gossypium australe]|uniref:Taxadiene 5-alpha hydroxylase n=1 Tax=Gossypium australe TaxID=47621 RepID=A0A5B6VX53_9ROSI|nr:taxadiene 5-alpha hydroxylase [Gossypium australe]
MLRSYVMDFEINWEKYIPLVKFAYKHRYHASLKMSPFEELYGLQCRKLACWIELDERKIIGPDLVRKTKEKVKIICHHLKAAHDR